MGYGDVHSFSEEKKTEASQIAVLFVELMQIQLVGQWHYIVLDMGRILKDVQVKVLLCIPTLCFLSSCPYAKKYYAGIMWIALLWM